MCKVITLELLGAPWPTEWRGLLGVKPTQKWMEQGEAGKRSWLWGLLGSTHPRTVTLFLHKLKYTCCTMLYKL